MNKSDDFDFDIINKIIFYYVFKYNLKYRQKYIIFSVWKYMKFYVQEDISRQADFGIKCILICFELFENLLWWRNHLRLLTFHIE